MSLKETKKIDTNRYQLEIAIDGEKFREAIKEVYKKNGKKISVPGFRKGKAPLNIIETIYGTEVFFEDGTIYGFIQILFDGLGLSNIMRTCTFLKTWWYMSAAIVFIFLLPVLGRMKNKIGYFFLIISIILFPRVLGLDYVGGTHAFSYFIPLVLGMMCSEYDLFVKLKQYHYEYSVRFHLAPWWKKILMALNIRGMSRNLRLLRKPK